MTSVLPEEPSELCWGLPPRPDAQELELTAAQGEVLLAALLTGVGVKRPQNWRMRTTFAILEDWDLLRPVPAIRRWVLTDDGRDQAVWLLHRHPAILEGRGVHALFRG